VTNVQLLILETEINITLTLQSAVVSDVIVGLHLKMFNAIQV